MHVCASIQDQQQTIEQLRRESQSSTKVQQVQLSMAASGVSERDASDVDEDEIIRMPLQMAQQLAHADERQLLNQVFAQLDTEGVGTIGREQLVGPLKQVGKTDQEVDAALSELGADRAHPLAR